MRDKWSAIDNLLEKLTDAYLAIDKLISRCQIDAKCTIAEMRLLGDEIGETPTGQSALIVGTSLGGRGTSLGAVLGAGSVGLQWNQAPNDP